MQFHYCMALFLWYSCHKHAVLEPEIHKPNR
jgi:hypothetical protein